jgi:UDP-N-acetylmuramoyl-tripeptide--D-alanyl-D-alanine ligase
MVQFSPDELAAATGGRWSAPPPSAPTGFAIDTRHLRAGQAFVALRTAQRDGHDFLPAARQGGASAALVSRPDAAVDLAQLVVADPLAAFQAVARRHRQRFAGPVVGISGSAGKTSTKELLALLLGGRPAGAGTAPAADPVLATVGNLNNHLGVPLTLTRLDGAVHRHAVIEAGIGAAGEMAPLAAMIAPDVAIITLVAPAHLGGLGDLAGVAREKAILPAAVRAGGLALFPASCAAWPAFRALAGAILVVGRAAELAALPPPRAGEERVAFAAVHRREGTTLTLAGEPAASFGLRRVSDGMAQNAVLAICAARRLGVADALIRDRLATWQPAPLRGEQRRTGGKLFYVDCYNANPAAMADAVAAFATDAPPDQPRLFVLGGMEELGAEAARYHRELGRSLHLRPGDFLFIIAAEAAAVRAGALENGVDPAQIEIVASLAPIADRLASFRGAVFIKGSRKYALESLLGEAAHA